MKNASALLVLGSLGLSALLLATPASLARAQGHKPAQEAPKPAAGAEGLEARVALLEAELASAKKTTEELRGMLEQTVKYLERQAKGSKTLLGVLDQSEQQGFAVGENWNARVTLLAGLRAYWGELSTGAPALPAAPAAKPAAPVRPTRPAK